MNHVVQGIFNIKIIAYIKEQEFVNNYLTRSEFLNCNGLVQTEV